MRMIAGSPERLREKEREKQPPQEGVVDLILRQEAEEVEIPKEVESWLEKIEKKEAKVPKVTDDQGQMIIKATEEEEIKVVLPMSKKQFAVGLKEKTGKATRWLAEQCFRLIKIYKGKVRFKKGETE